MIEPYFSLTINWRTVASKADIAGSEFWVNDNLTPEDSIIKDLFGPAPDTSELYGKNLVWAEAFTANAYCSAWRNDPALLKPYGDNAFRSGSVRTGAGYFGTVRQEPRLGGGIHRECLLQCLAQRSRPPQALRRQCVPIGICSDRRRILRNCTARTSFGRRHSPRMPTAVPGATIPPSSSLTATMRSATASTTL